ncbi:MAG: D-alanyl-D-alanine carboxypeptidase family protein [Desulfosarcina sp.]|nr:D-alanyl-D-alanine carboxypeptidase family protein [Desulfobacterales bacterium]
MDIKRRDFIKITAAAILSSAAGQDVLAGIAKAASAQPEESDSYIKDYLHKIHNFDQPHKNDIYLNSAQLRILKSSVARLKRLQKTVGHANFYLLNFDEALKISRGYSRVGRFPKSEIDFLETIFYENSSRYGFFGEKPFKDITSRIRKQEVVKIPHTGNYLYKGEPCSAYNKIKKEIGDNAILTSGVRSIIKQFLLFLDKACRNKGNLSLASRSLAPPGYSFHGIGDFDVGQIGFGYDNFTERFTTTDVFKKLQKFGYINLRYKRNNLLGVRFEP